jgi:hypothetical protein
MKFNSVSSDIPNQESRWCQGNFHRLTLELGIRKNNQHVGSGLGGNNFQLLVLMGLQHRLIRSRRIQIGITDKGITWGSEFLLQPMTKIRHKLDEIFPVIQAKHKVMAAAIEGMLWHKDSYYGSVVEHKESFPGLMTYLGGGEYQHDPSMPLHEQLLMAMVITTNLATQLDRKDLSRMAASGRAMSHFSGEIFLLSVRMNIQIDRLVQHNMDEDPVWLPLLMKICKEVDQQN